MDVSSALLFWHFFCAGSLKTLLQGCEHRCINWLYSNTQCSCTPVNVISWYNFHMETALLFHFRGTPHLLNFLKSGTGPHHSFQPGPCPTVKSSVSSGENVWWKWLELLQSAIMCRHIYIWRYMMTSGASKQSSLIASPTVFPLPKSSKSFWATSVLTQCSLQLSNKCHF